MADTEEFYIASVGRLLGQLFPVTGDLHEAEEIVQEAYARASTRWSRLRDYDIPEAWVRRVAMNLAADRGRRLQRQARALLRGGAVLMIDLRERLQELADAAHPRGRHARRRPRHPPRPLARLDLHRDLSGAGSVITQMHRDLASVAEPCAGGSRRAELVGYVRSHQYRRLVMVVAVPPEPDETSVCWTAEMFELGGAGRWTCR